MSNRTRLSDKAIREAWKREKELVQEGKATRDWTPEQQQDILERGKAYDDNGKAFISHHMISVENMPEYQGCPENIQFLTQEEHLAAHGGNFHNRTKGYYNPETREMEVFEGDIYTPCEVINLSSPIGWNADTAEKEKSAESDISLAGDENKEAKAESPPQSAEKEKTKNNEPSNSPRPIYRQARPFGLKEYIKLYARKGFGYLAEHKYEIIRNVIKVGTTAAKVYMEIKMDEIFDDDDDEYYYEKRDKDETDIESVKPTDTPVTE